MGQWIKVFVLLMINIIIAGAILYFLDYMRIIDFKSIAVFSSQKISFLERVEDPLLLEKEELNKKWELLSIQEAEISNRSQIIIESNTLLQAEQQKLQDERESFINEQMLVALQQEEDNTYEVKINDVATQIGGMPPQTAAELLNLQDDLQVVDILNTMNQIAIAGGQASTVPFLLTLMEREKSARIQTLMLTTTDDY